MARYDFKQGLARYQEDGIGHPAFLQRNGQYIDLIVSPDPTVFLIAHYDVDYSLTENRSIDKAWGPFTNNNNSWLFWDVDFITGEISHGFTEVMPVNGTRPPAQPIAIDQHWFDTGKKVTKVWNGATWVDKLRVFACKYQNNATIIYNTQGSQVGLHGLLTFAGFPLFDDENKPIQKFRKNRTGQFITSETPISAQFARIANFRVEAATVQAKARENIAINYAVAYYGYNEIGLARNTDSLHPAIGIAAEPMVLSEVRSYVTKGYVQNNVNWNWSDYPVGQPLFVGPTGELIVDPPQFWTIQQIATVVDSVTIFVDTQQQIIYE
jgi:hypothetical protein